MSIHPPSWTTLLPPYAKLVCGAYLDPIQMPSGAPCPPDQHLSRAVEFADTVGPDLPGICELYCLDIWNEFAYPAEAVKRVAGWGGRPLVIMMDLLPVGQQLPGHRLEEIGRGSLDAVWARLGRAVRAAGVYVLVAWGWEVNVSWAWSGLASGGFEFAPVGNSPETWPIGPQCYRTAARRAQDIIDSESGGMVTWVLSGAPNLWYGPGNELYRYRTGREAACVIGLSTAWYGGGKTFDELILYAEAEAAPLTGMAHYVELAAHELPEDATFKPRFWRDAAAYFGDMARSGLFWHQGGGGIILFDYREPLTADASPGGMHHAPRAAVVPGVASATVTDNPFSLASSEASLAAVRDLARESRLFSTHLQEYRA